MPDDGYNALLNDDRFCSVRVPQGRSRTPHSAPVDYPRGHVKRNLYFLARRGILSPIKMNSIIFRKVVEFEQYKLAEPLSVSPDAARVMEKVERQKQQKVNPVAAALWA